MKVEQLYTGCLAEAAYFIESQGEVAIIDPLRETQPYIALAEEHNGKIKYIFETHFHADFVSGHVDLARQTGATIVFGPTANPNYEVHNGTDGELFHIGKVTIKLLHTPGHTLESSTYLLFDEEGKEHAIFTGDTLFIGDVGRPDLAIKTDLTQEDLAGLLYDSLHSKIMPLPDDVIIYPAHGAGSACGKHMSDQTYATLGDQKEANYALKAKSKKEFIEQVTDGIMPPPQYFPKNAMINKMGYDHIEEVMAKGMDALTPEEVAQEMFNNALVLDTRDPQVFAQGHIPGAVNIGLDGSFAVWVGTLIEDLNQAIIVVAEEGREEEAVMRLARVGYDNCIGYLANGMKAWLEEERPVSTIESIEATQLEQLLKVGTIELLDARKPNEYEVGHVKGASNYPLDYINQQSSELDKHATYYIHCRSGYRSMVMASLLKREGFQHIIDIKGGYLSIRKTEIPTERVPETVEG